MGGSGARGAGTHSVGDHPKLHLAVLFFVVADFHGVAVAFAHALREQTAQLVVGRGRDSGGQIELGGVDALEVVLLGVATWRVGVALDGVLTRAAVRQA